MPNFRIFVEVVTTWSFPPGGTGSVRTVKCGNRNRLEIIIEERQVRSLRWSRRERRGMEGEEGREGKEVDGGG